MQGRTQITSSTACSKPVIAEWSSFLHKRYHLGGDTRRRQRQKQSKSTKRHIYNIKNNNTDNFVMLLNEIRAKDLKIEKVIGDEPTKYFDSKTSREESTQKRFYMRGLHKKQGRFSRAVDHLIENEEVKEDRDCEDDVVNETSCGKIDMSGIDFGNKKTVTSSKLQDQNDLMRNKEEAPSTLSSTVVAPDNENNSPVTSEMESKLLNDNIKKPTSILYEG